MLYINFIFANVNIDMRNKINDNFIFNINDDFGIKIGLIKPIVDCDMYNLVVCFKINADDEYSIKNEIKKTGEVAQAIILFWLTYDAKLADHDFSEKILSPMYFLSDNDYLFVNGVMPEKISNVHYDLVHMVLSFSEFRNLKYGDMIAIDGNVDWFNMLNSNADHIISCLVDNRRRFSLLFYAFVRPHIDQKYQFIYKCAENLARKDNAKEISKENWVELATNLNDFTKKFNINENELDYMAIRNIRQAISHSVEEGKYALPHETNEFCIKSFGDKYGAVKYIVFIHVFCKYILNKDGVNLSSEFISEGNENQEQKAHLI
jgi:hypothetical protein